MPSKTKFIFTDFWHIFFWNIFWQIFDKFFGLIFWQYSGECNGIHVFFSIFNPRSESVFVAWRLTWAVPPLLHDQATQGNTCKLGNRPRKNHPKNQPNLLLSKEFLPLPAGAANHHRAREVATLKSAIWCSSNHLG